MNKNIKTMTSSVDMDWITPQEFVDALPFDFDVDVCATAESAKARFFISPETNALEVPWIDRARWSKAPQHRVLRRRTKETTVCWMNPPYGRDIGRWIEKAYEESLRDATVVCLVPARTETAWFNRVWSDAYLICFLGRRIRFERADGGPSETAPFPNAVAVFGRISDVVGVAYRMSKIGTVIVPGYGNIWPFTRRESDAGEEGVEEGQAR